MRNVEALEKESKGIMEFHELEKICKKNVCGAIVNEEHSGKVEVWGEVHEYTYEQKYCENPIVIKFNDGKYEPYCIDHGVNPPLRKIKSYTRKVKDGEPVPLHVLNVIQKEVI